MNIQVLLVSLLFLQVHASDDQPSSATPNAPKLTRKFLPSSRRTISSTSSNQSNNFSTNNLFESSDDENNMHRMSDKNMLEKTPSNLYFIGQAGAARVSESMKNQIITHKLSRTIHDVIADIIMLAQAQEAEKEAQKNENQRKKRAITLYNRTKIIKDPDNERENFTEDEQ